MMDSRKLTEEQNDLRGICATGRIFEFETLVNGETQNKLWTSDCSGSKGSAAGDVPGVISMFLNQIPDGRKMAQGVGLDQQDTMFKL